MGCTASKLDNEDSVRRCKERCRLMKAAVYARHHLAAAHSDYCRSLRLTGAALASFAAGEPLQVLNSAPVVLPSPSTTTTAFNNNNNKKRPPPSLSRSSSSSFSATLHQPPQPPSLSPSSVPPPPSLSHTRQKPMMKLPHILSESSQSPSSSPTNTHISSSSSSRNPYNNNAYYAVPNYSATPSQASSVWNWENFYPPSPPDSDFFNHNQQQQQQQIFRRRERDSASETSNFDYFYDRRQTRHLPADDEAEREEVQCSEWDDHYSSSSTSSSPDAEEEDAADHRDDSRSEIGTRSNFGQSVRSEPAAPAYHPPPPPPMMSKSEKADDAGSSVSREISDKKMVVSHKDLKEIVDAIREYFDKAAAAGEQLSDMLEAGRAQLDRSFRQIRKTLHHSSNVFSNLSSNWTSKPPLAVKYQIDTSLLVETGGTKSLCSTLERLLAWEKKLYSEVKAREGAKIEHEKKLATLQSQEYKGEDEAKLDKTKTSIKKLQSVIIVTSQAVSTTSNAIYSLKDSDLVPQLINLCHGLKYMWNSMNEFHEIQSCIAQQVRGLVNQAVKGDSTSDLHRQVTRELESAVSAWHSSFSRLIKFQRDFIQSLHGWLKLTLLPIHNGNVSSNKEPSEAFAFFDEWKLALERIPDTVASEAIKSFVNVVHVISVKQAEELKIKKRTEAASKELEKKSTGIRNLEKKFYQSYSVVGLGIPDTGPDNGHILDARDPLAEKKIELAACRRRVEDEALRHSKAVEVTRAMTLNNIQTALPGVFQAMTNFSALFVEAMEAVCTRSYAIK